MLKTILSASLLLAASSAFAQPASAPSVVQGKVLETMEAGTYTYVRISTKSGETWAAVPKTSIKKGSDVTIENPMTMDGFESKSLKRKFDRIVFGTLSEGKGMVPAQSGMNPHGSIMGGKDVDLGSIKVAKAEGADGRTVAEVYAQKAELKDKKVAVRGKVVKVNVAIMGKNWVHLRDGSGAVKDGNFDLIFTTKDLPKMGEEVLAKGTVQTDRDLGAGYKYSILIEDASFSKK